MSVAVTRVTGGTLLVTKGAVEEMLAVCRYVQYRGQTVLLTDDIIREIRETVRKLNDDGMRVIAVARKNYETAAPGFLRRR